MIIIITLNMTIIARSYCIRYITYCMGLKKINNNRNQPIKRYFHLLDEFISFKYNILYFISKIDSNIKL